MTGVLHKMCDFPPHGPRPRVPRAPGLGVPLELVPLCVLFIAVPSQSAFFLLRWLQLGEVLARDLHEHGAIDLLLAGVLPDGRDEALSLAPADMAAAE